MARRARFEIPADVVDAWVPSHGELTVRDWVVDTRARAAWCAEAWQLRIEGFLPGGSLSCVLACRRADGSRVVLKLLAPWGGCGDRLGGSRAVGVEGLRGDRLLERSADGRALLLARVGSGRSFVPSGDDGDDCERVARTLRALVLAPVTTGLPALSAAVHARFERARVAGRPRGAWVSADALDAAERRAVELAQSAGRRTAVHGDAQNKNLLVDGACGALVAIDPEPSVGDPHFDPALWALTHRPGVGVRERCAVLAGLPGSGTLRFNSASPDDERFFDVFDKNDVSEKWVAEADAPWITLSADKGRTFTEQRVTVTVDWSHVDASATGTIRVYNRGGHEKTRAPVATFTVQADESAVDLGGTPGHIEANG